MQYRHHLLGDRQVDIMHLSQLQDRLTGRESLACLLCGCDGIGHGVPLPKTDPERAVARQG